MFERPLNQRFDARKSERHGDSITGFLSWQDMPELAKVTENDLADRMHVSVRFELTEDRVHALHLELAGQAALVCQRCLDIMHVDLSGGFKLALVAT